MGWTVNRRPVAKSDERVDWGERAGLLDRKRRKAPTEVDDQARVDAAFDVRKDDAEIDVAALIAKRRDVGECELDGGVAVDEAGEAVADEVERIADGHVERGLGKRGAFTYVVAAAAARATRISGSTAERLLDATGTGRAKNTGRGHRGLVQTVYGNNTLIHSYPHNLVDDCWPLAWIYKTPGSLGNAAVLNQPFRRLGTVALAGGVRVIPMSVKAMCVETKAAERSIAA